MRIQKSTAETQRGTLYIVGTPIGNLEDMTFRAIRILREVDCIAAEDTRQTRKLLTHFEIGTRLISYHEHNKQASGPELIRMMEEGRCIALVSDAGMPAISDPGYDLVRLAIAHQIAVVPVPGANAALSALVVSGLPTERFLFVGFLPREPKRIKEQLEQLRGCAATVILYESPHRVAKTVAAMQDVWGGETPIALVRELTKRYEEVARGTIAEANMLLQEQEAKGEYCLVVDLTQVASDSEEEGSFWSAMSISEHVRHYEASGLSRKDAMKRAAADRGSSRRDIYQALLDAED